MLLDDGYIPKYSVLELYKAWPGLELRSVGMYYPSFPTMVNSGGQSLMVFDNTTRRYQTGK